MGSASAAARPFASAASSSASAATSSDEGAMSVLCPVGSEGSEEGSRRVGSVFDEQPEQVNSCSCVAVSENEGVFNKLSRVKRNEQNK